MFVYFLKFLIFAYKKLFNQTQNALKHDNVRFPKNQV